MSSFIIKWERLVIRLKAKKLTTDWSIKRKLPLWSSETLTTRWSTSQEGPRCLHLDKSLGVRQTFTMTLFSKDNISTTRHTPVDLRQPSFALMSSTCWLLPMLTIKVVCFAIGTIPTIMLCVRSIRNLPIRPHISADFSMDSFTRDVTKPSVQQVQMSREDRSYLTDTYHDPPDISMNTVAFNPNTDFGKMFTGVDYYGILTSQPGAQQCVVTADGNSGKRLTFKVDAFEHNGTLLRALLLFGTLSILVHSFPPRFNFGRSLFT